jgi:hypothetical protein
MRAMIVTIQITVLLQEGANAGEMLVYILRKPSVSCLLAFELTDFSNILLCNAVLTL